MGVKWKPEDAETSLLDDVQALSTGRSPSPSAYDRWLDSYDSEERYTATTSDPRMERMALESGCPQCQAVSGQLCVTPKGSRRSELHNARYSAHLLKK